MDTTAVLSVVKRIPESTRDAIARGFEVADTLPSHELDTILEKILGNVLNGASYFDLKTIIQEPVLPRDKAQSIFNAISGFVEIVYETDADLESFLTATQDHIYDPKNADSARKIAIAIFNKKADLLESINRSNLAAETLPSLKQFELSVDLRPRFHDDQITTVVPVAITHISTDTDGPELWLQLSKADIARLISSLEKTQRQMDIAEATFQISAMEQRHEP